jgi:endonuclease III
MKNSKDYSGKIKKLYRLWKRQGTSQTAPVYEEPLEALVAALISERYPDTEARKIYKRMQSHFTDLNDLRVSRTEEIIEVMDDHSESAQAAAQVLTRILNQVYDRYDMMTLASLKGMGKRQGRKEIEDLEGVSRFVADYCFLTALGGHAIPLTESMKALLVKEQLIHPEATEEEIHGFLERQIPAAEAWSFYTLLRAAAEGTLTVTEPASSPVSGSDLQEAAKDKKKPAVRKAAGKTKSPGKSATKK